MIQHYVIKFASDLRQVGDFLWVIVFRVTERNETKRNDCVSCFSNYYRRTPPNRTLCLLAAIM
jgi:hypothetical protein